MSANHTPGPWQIDAITVDRRSAYAIRDAAGDRIALARRQDVPASIADANARLIAAAPELLEALKCVVAALSQPVQFSGSKDGADILRGDATMARNTALAAIAKTTE